MSKESGFDSSKRQEIFVFSLTSRPALGLIQPPIQVIPGAMWPRREADHSPPSSAEVKNGGAIPPLSHPPSGLSA
jgi:hypothetical protein